MSSKEVFPQVTIDLMDKADLPEIMAIERESFASPWTAGMFAKEIDSAHSMCLCVQINFGSKNVVGAYIIFWLVADEAHLHNLAVKKEYRSQGLAFGLMEAMNQIAGANKITAQTPLPLSFDIPIWNLKTLTSSLVSAGKRQSF